MNRIRIDFLFFVLSLALTCLCACSSRQSLSESPANDASLDVVNDAPLKILAKAKGETPLPEVSDFGVVVVWRKSNQPQESGTITRRFHEAEVEISLTHEPRIGDKVTLIPLGVNIDPFQASIIGAEKKEETCTGKKFKEYYWDANIERITDRRILDIDPIESRRDEFPFDIAAVVPSVEFAKNLENRLLKKEMLPKGTSIDTIQAAIDLDNDGRPDLLYTVFCCDDETRPESNNCDYVCEKYFKRLANGTWKLLRSNNPC